MRFEEYYEPDTIEECSRLLIKFGDHAKLLAGGTDLVPKLKNKIWHPQAVIGLFGIPGMDAITVSEEGLTLGSLAVLRTIQKDSEIGEKYVAVREACGHVSSLQVRNIATIGGNACNASPSADAVEGLLIHNAVCDIYSAEGERKVPLCEFFTGPGKTVLKTGEILRGFFVPAPKPHTGCAYKKYTIRGDSDISIVGAGARVTLGEDGKVADCRISLASVAPTPLISSKTEEFLIGKELTKDVIAKAGDIASGNIRPITDARGTAEYRVEMVRVWTRHALEEAYERAQNN